MKNIFEKIRNKSEKNEIENFQLFILNSYILQILITKTSILSDHENVVLF